MNPQAISRADLAGLCRTIGPTLYVWWGMRDSNSHALRAIVPKTIAATVTPIPQDKLMLEVDQAGN